MSVEHCWPLETVRRRPRVRNDHHRTTGWDAVAMNRMRTGCGYKPMSSKSFSPILMTCPSLLARTLPAIMN